MDYKRIIDYFKNRDMKKNMNDLFIILVIGLILVITINFFSSNKKTYGYVEVNNNNIATKNDINEKDSYEVKVKQELIDVLKKINGVGEVDAMISFESGNEQIPTFSQNISQKTTQEDDGNGGTRITNENNSLNTIVNTNEGSSNKPFIVKEVYPKISGIIVVAEGAENPDVKYNLYQAVKTVFNIEQYKVNVYPMNKTNK